MPPIPALPGPGSPAARRRGCRGYGVRLGGARRSPRRRSSAACHVSGAGLDPPGAALWTPIAEHNRGSERQAIHTHRGGAPGCPATRSDDTP
ncbi:hypothetical protein [Ornithinimicrobium kibberense]|uniref:hypothetical protein n=1 Tax=Ornithinimicrobium kibberense TaxID=282060 RepID=UPI00360DCA14